MRICTPCREDGGLGLDGGAPLADGADGVGAGREGGPALPEPRGPLDGGGREVPGLPGGSAPRVLGLPGGGAPGGPGLTGGGGPGDPGLLRGADLD